MQLILVTGLKGGVGKTTTSVELARALTRAGKRVAILDIDYRTPNVPVAMDAEDTELSHTYEGDVLIPPVIDGIKLMSMAYIWPPGKAVQVKDDDAMEDVRHLLTPGIVNWDHESGPTEYLVVDTPPTSVGVVEVALTAPNVRGAVIVSHASRVSRHDARQTIDLFRESEVPILGMVCNQSVDTRGEMRYDLEPRDIEALAAEYGLPYLATVPHTRDRAVMEPCFDAIAQMVLTGATVTLEVPPTEEEPWRRLVSLTRTLKESGSS